MGMTLLPTETLSCTHVRIRTDGVKNTGKFDLCTGEILYSTRLCYSLLSLLENLSLIFFFFYEIIYYYLSFFYEYSKTLKASSPFL